MNTQRRKLLGALAAGLGATGLASTAQGAEAKPLTTTGIARTLLGLADKAILQGMPKAHDILTQAASEILKGEPQVGKLAKREVTR